MHKDLEEKNSIIKDLLEKYESVEKVINENLTIKEDLKDKDAKINGLEIKLEESEKAQQKHKKHFEKKLKEIENLCKQKMGKEKMLENSLPEKKNIQCNKCDYTTTTRQGLKIHNSKVHSKIDFVTFPAVCDVCEMVLETETKLKDHKKKEHTYHIVKFQCNECEFMASDPHTLQVHFGLNHSLPKQCGLCDNNFKTFQEVTDHLSQCEIFVCSNSHCKDTFGSLTEMKEHISEDHKKGSPAHYSFSYYKCHSRDNSEKQIKKQGFLHHKFFTNVFFNFSQRSSNLAVCFLQAPVYLVLYYITVTENISIYLSI